MADAAGFGNDRGLYANDQAVSLIHDITFTDDHAGSLIYVTITVLRPGNRHNR